MSREGLGRLFDVGTTIVPVDASAGAQTGLRTHLKNAGGLDFLVLLSAAASGVEDVTFTLQEANAATGGTAQNLATIDHYYRKAEATLDNDETWTRVNQTKAATITVAGATFSTQQVMLVIPVSGESLSDGFEWVLLNSSDPGTVARLVTVIPIVRDLNVQRAPANLADLNT